MAQDLDPTSAENAPWPSWLRMGMCDCGGRTAAQGRSRHEMLTEAPVDDQEELSSGKLRAGGLTPPPLQHQLIEQEDDEKNNALFVEAIDISALQSASSSPGPSTHTEGHFRQSFVPAVSHTDSDTEERGEEMGAMHSLKEDFGADLEAIDECSELSPDSPPQRSAREPSLEEQNQAARKIQRAFLTRTARRRRWRMHQQLLLAVKLSKKKGGTKHKKKQVANMKKQQLMAQKYWIEAADPKHRYGSLLVPYYHTWLESGVNDSFFKWLDQGKGSELDLEESPRQHLMESKVDYLDKKGREECAVEFTKDDKGDVRLCYKVSGERVSTPQMCCMFFYRFGLAAKYIFVVDANHTLYTHRKKTGHFHHSSFLGGMPAIAAGGLVVKDGKLLLVNANSGHYKPTAKMIKKTFKHFEDEFGLDCDSYVKVYPRTLKPCGMSCCLPIAGNSPCQCCTTMCGLCGPSSDGAVRQDSSRVL